MRVCYHVLLHDVYTVRVGDAGVGGTQQARVLSTRTPGGGLGVLALNCHSATRHTAPGERIPPPAPTVVHLSISCSSSVMRFTAVLVLMVNGVFRV